MTKKDTERHKDIERDRMTEIETEAYGKRETEERVRETDKKKGKC